MKSLETLEKIRMSNRRTARDRAIKLSENWKNPEKRAKYIVNMNNPEMIAARIEKFKKYIRDNYEDYLSKMNNPDRISKISKTSKKMWSSRTSEEAKILLPKPGSRNHIVNGISMNFPESKIAQRLNAQNISWIYEKSFGNEKNRFYPDFYLPDYEIVIECFGDYWHANPNKYQKNDILFEDIKVEDVWKADEYRLNMLRESNLIPFVFWESDLVDDFKIDELIRDAISKSKYIVEDVTLSELAHQEFGLSDFGTNNIGIYDFENEIEVLSIHDGEKQYKKISSLVIKESVETHYRLGDLRGSASHRVFFNDEWVELKNHPHAEFVESPIQIVDISVPETQCYFANGQLNHNTTSGGMAIPFHASTRIQLIGGSKIEKDGELIGINVEAKLVKNKVAAPFRRACFQIHFGVGIKDHEETFDVMREYCDEHGPQEIGGKFVCISGKGAWKTLTVADSLKDHEAQKFSLEKKFYKEKFDELWKDEKYRENLEKLLEIVLVKTPQQYERDIKKEALENNDASDV